MKTIFLKVHNIFRTFHIFCRFADKYFFECYNLSLRPTNITSRKSIKKFFKEVDENFFKEEFDEISSKKSKKILLQAKR